jgi:hypothetical protein
VAIIPREVWRFCVDQIKLYPLNEAAYHTQLEEIRASYIEAGMSGPPDQSGIVTYSGESPTTGRYESQESALHSPQLRYLSRCVTIMDLVQRDPDSGDVLDAIWSKGWRDNSMIALEAKTSARSVARAKQDIVRRVAAGWGLW